MTYQEKIQLIEKLKNLVWPLDGHGIFFRFHSETEFTIEFLTEETIKLVENRELARIQYCLELPYAAITYNRWGHEILIYAEHRMEYCFNLTSGQLEAFCHANDPRPFDPEQMKKEINRLIKKLEQR